MAFDWTSELGASLALIISAADLFILSDLKRIDGIISGSTERKERVEKEAEQVESFRQLEARTAN